MTETERTRLRAAIGPRADYYLAQFDKIERSGNAWAGSWNWPAFFASTGWLAYRRVGYWSLLNFFLPLPFIVLILAAGTRDTFWILIPAYLAFAYVVIPLFANALYNRHLKTQLASAGTAAEMKAQRWLRPPSIGTGIEGVLKAGLSFAIAAFLLASPAAYNDYAPRAKVAEGVLLASSLKEPIVAFYIEHKRLPASHESEKFLAEGGRYTRSAIYDADQRMIVVTMGEMGVLEGKRLALHVEERDGTISWTCRTIDIDRRYLPAACRDCPACKPIKAASK